MLSLQAVQFALRDLFTDPLDAEEIRRLLGDRPAADWFSTKSPRFKELGLAGKSLTDPEIVALMAAEPYLVKRPSVARAERLIAVGLSEIEKIR